MDLLLNGAGDLVMRDEEKAEASLAFFTLVFMCRTAFKKFVSEISLDLKTPGWFSGL